MKRAIAILADAVEGKIESDSPNDIRVCHLFPTCSAKGYMVTLSSNDAGLLQSHFLIRYVAGQKRLLRACQEISATTSFVAGCGNSTRRGRFSRFKFTAASSASVTLIPAGYVRRSMAAFTFSPSSVLVAPISFTIDVEAGQGPALAS